MKHSPLLQLVRAFVRTNLPWRMALVIALCGAAGRAHAQAPTNAYATYALRNVAASDAGPRVESALRGMGQVVVDRRMNRLYVRGGADAQQTAQQVLAQLDRQPAPPVTDRPVEHGARQSRPCRNRCWSPPLESAAETARRVAGAAHPASRRCRPQPRMPGKPRPRPARSRKRRRGEAGDDRCAR